MVVATGPCIVMAEERWRLDRRYVPQTDSAIMRSVSSIAAGIALLCVSGCQGDIATGPPANGKLAVGTWGGDSAGVIVTDTLSHVHVGCTYGDMGRVTLDADGRFAVAGSYLLRAYPIAIGPTMPAQFVGRVSGSILTLTVTVSDTIARTVVVRGPVSVRFGIEPRMQNCPICRIPGDRSSTLRPTVPSPQGHTGWFGALLERIRLVFR